TAPPTPLASPVLAPPIAPTPVSVRSPDRAVQEIVRQSRESVPQQRDNASPAPRAAEASPQPVASARDSSRIEQILLEIIGEKTGYPPEMLDLDMALDADLGIDSIKRVEILSALQERLPEAPLIKPEHLGSLHNLRQIVAFLSETGNGHAPPPPPKP